ncbi:uncharacterized protein VTP21DRAFT_3282 [Calcarisporiella thermophila]|uniref:uncharacterized protein n=1 Tax=Calcarisporiella thermophila TaxID=911321 RepID=UPI003742FD04
MNFDFSRVIGNPFLLITICASALGFLLLFGATCAIGNGLNWWLVFFELFLIAGIIFGIITGELQAYRFAVMGFLVYSVAMLSVSSAAMHSSSAAWSVMLAGNVVLLLVQFLWILVFGSEDESYIAHRVNAVPMSHPARHSRPRTSHLSHASQTVISPPASPFVANSLGRSTLGGSATALHSPPMSMHTVATGGNPTDTVLLTPNAEYQHRAKAIYSYSANPDDPNEISFAKGEVLEISSIQGKWWSARKSDGTVGIAPSNYLQLVEKQYI